MSANPSIRARDHPMVLCGTLLDVLSLTIAAIALPWSAHCQATTPQQGEQRIVLQEAGSRFPKLTGRVVDEAHIITDEDKEAIISFTAEHERHTTNQIVVVTVNSLRGMPIGQFSAELGNYWHIGHFAVQLCLLRHPG